MKLNRAVLNRVQKYRERKGLRIIDTDSPVYTVSKFFYIVGFAWFAAIQLMFFLGQALILSDATKAELVYMNHFYIITAAVAVVIAGFVLLLLGKHILGAILNVLPLAVVTYEDYVLLVLKNQDIDSMTKFTWRHLIPAILMILAGGIMCLIALRAKALLKRDYTRVLEALYVTYKDRLHGSSEEEWEVLLAELDDAALENEMDKQHTKEYKQRKAAESSEEESNAEVND